MRERRTKDLRKGRVSIPDARYFLTLCAVRPTNLLMAVAVADSIRSAIQRSVDDLDYTLLCGMLMPDHLHLCVRLSHRLSIGQVVGKLKSATRTALGTAGCRWQSNFFEHRLRADESVSQYALYMFLNPYRAKILERRKVWPGWMRGSISFDFDLALEESKYPPEEWLLSDAQALGLTAADVGSD